MMTELCNECGCHAIELNRISLPNLPDKWYCHGCYEEKLKTIKKAMAENRIWRTNNVMGYRLYYNDQIPRILDDDSITILKKSDDNTHYTMHLISEESVIQITVADLQRIQMPSETLDETAVRIAATITEAIRHLF